MIIKEAFRLATNRYLAEGSEFASGILRAYARLKCPSAPAPSSHWRKALILGDNHIGDLLYRSGSLEVLKRGLPECDFTYLASAGSEPVLSTSPWLKSVISFPESDSRLDLLNEPSLMLLKQMGFDAVLCSNPLHYYQDLKLALELGIPSRAGYTHKGLSGWVTHPIKIHYPQPFPNYFRDFVAQLTGQEATWSSRPVVHTTQEDSEEAETLWRKLQLDPTKPVVACFMTSRQSSGVWPSDSFAQTLQILSAKKDVTLVLCGAKGDEALLNRINQEYGLQAKVNAGEIGLRALVCFLKRVSVVISTDSGPRHLSNAAGVPVVFIRNLSFNKREAGTYCETEYDMAPDVECLPPRDQERWLKQATPERVAAKALEILGQATAGILTSDRRNRFSRQDAETQRETE